MKNINTSLALIVSGIIGISALSGCSGNKKIIKDDTPYRLEYLLNEEPQFIDINTDGKPDRVYLKENNKNIDVIVNYGIDPTKKTLAYTDSKVMWSFPKDVTIKNHREAILLDEDLDGNYDFKIMPKQENISQDENRVSYDNIMLNLESYKGK
jgi:hypothetical protein